MSFDWVHCKYITPASLKTAIRIQDRSIIDLVIYLFCTNCGPEIGLPCIAIKTKAISCLELVQNR